jgi:hypothetical protein
MRTLGQSITLAILQAAVNMANRTVRSTTLLPTISLVPQRRLMLLRANKAFGLCLSKTILVVSGLGKGLLSSIISDKPTTILGSLAQCRNKVQGCEAF